MCANLFLVPDDGDGFRHLVCSWIEGVKNGHVSPGKFLYKRQCQSGCSQVSSRYVRFRLPSDGCFWNFPHLAPEYCRARVSWRALFLCSHELRIDVLAGAPGISDSRRAPLEDILASTRVSHLPAQHFYRDVCPCTFFARRSPSRRTPCPV